MNKIIKTNVSRFALHDARDKGQILLILVMIMAIAITIVLTITFTSRTDTQLTKLEEESQKALAAAEAGIEASLKSGSDISDLSTVGGLGSTISSGTTTVTSASSAQFVSPTLSSGEAFTFYLGSYDKAAKTVSSPASANTISVAYDTSSSAQCDKIVLDIAVVSTNGVVRSVSDVGGVLGKGVIGTTENNTVSGTTYRCKSPAIAVTALSTQRFLIVRYISVSGPTNSSLGFTGTSTLPVSGQTVTSQATTRTGVTKKVQLFQSYPQIPAEFFFTSF